MDCRVGEGVQAQGTSRGRQKQEGFLEARGIPALSDRRKKEASRGLCLLMGPEVPHPATSSLSPGCP